MPISAAIEFLAENQHRRPSCWEIALPSSGSRENRASLYLVAHDPPRPAEIRAIEGCIMAESGKRTGLRWRAFRSPPLVLSAGIAAVLAILGAAQAPAREDGAVGITANLAATPGQGATVSLKGGTPQSAPAGARTSKATRKDLKAIKAAAHGRPPGPLRKKGARPATCPPTSVICLENSLPGNPPSEWDIVGAGSPSIQGYAADMSVNKGTTVDFKIDTDATDYRLDVYRIGYYSGMGARLITTLQPSATLPQVQPTCVSDDATGLVDCGNWDVSASWAVPDTVVSGVYLAKLVREDGTPGESQITFVIRDDTRGADVLVQTSDSTWQAYNDYGGNSLYTGSPAGRAFKVSYNRPFLNRSADISGSAESFFFNSEYPMVRWLEANAYDVSYATSVDTARMGAELLEHRAFLSVGHDEYWSLEMRNNVEAARASAVNLAFFSGNEMFWKTRWESSIAGPVLAFRTLVCYKETLANAKIDPSTQWTGTWRDPRFSPPSNGGRPENAVTGTMFQVNGTVSDSVAVPAAYRSMRLWRNTSVANLLPGQTAIFPAGTLGYEWDAAPDNLTTPAGSVKFSSATIGRLDKILLNFGGTYGPGVATHNLILYRHSSGARVFGAGTVQWSWGLDAVHYRPGTPTDIRMQQATVNLFADMNLQPASLQAGLVPGVPSPDTAPPTTTITSPSAGATVPSGTTVSIRGTAVDVGGGQVGGVEVSPDGGTRWFQAKGLTDWQYSWTTGSAGPVTILARAVDDSGNLQTSPTQRPVTISTPCPCTTWPPSATPATASQADPAAAELGVKFQPTSPGHISGIRFYKGTLNTGTHTGDLWSSTGQLLARATFTNESASGWQQVNFSTPVAVSANTTYVAAYHTTSGRYSVTRPYFTQQYSSGLLIGLANSAVTPGNGVYSYTATPAFPTSTYQATNYWVDVVFSPSSTLWDETAQPAIDSTGDSKAVVVGAKFRPTSNGVATGVRFYKSPQNTGTHVGSLWAADGTLLASATFTGETPSGWQQVNFATPVPLTANTTYVTAYSMNPGNYSITRPFFTTGYGRGPLYAPAGEEVAGSNGVYKYGPPLTFPNNTYQLTNYWVDVLFDATS
ncbi:N,N-dimethylformamidase beta subunit family domain-containing protein [Nonomuraea sp. NPDC049028]|uniref:N,N-dimethylformamidase beta subunit family domain-containing protein n=1 Tax=Nonomuraea sp. NPDC049028 TaxID=3364348 RepID=UPI0037235937